MSRDRSFAVPSEGPASGLVHRWPRHSPISYANKSWEVMRWAGAHLLPPLDVGQENRNMKKYLILLLMFSGSLYAIDDTPENRSREAHRYMEATPLEPLFADMAEQAAMNLPPDQQDAFKAMLTRNLDHEAVSKTVREAMIRHFTAEELKALADFYGSDVGRSAMQKFGVYMADVMPYVQAEMMRAMNKTNRELSERNREK